jgi:hypothetical protein
MRRQRRLGLRLAAASHDTLEPPASSKSPNNQPTTQITDMNKTHFQDYKGHPIMVLEVTNYLGHYFVLRMRCDSIYHDMDSAFKAGRTALDEKE